MRHMRLAQLLVAPVKYNPVEHKIIVYNDLDFEIILTGADMAATRVRQDTAWSPAFDWMEKMVLAPEALRFAKRNVAPGYLIVTDPLFQAEIAPFAAWKAKQGLRVSVVSTDQFGSGATLTEGLKAYLHNLYNQATSENPAPSFVLFVGDHEQIPAFNGQAGVHVTDLYYATVTPGDFLPEYMMGRFSAQNVEQLRPQIEKTMEYENGQFSDPKFLQEAVLVAGWDFNWTHSHGWPHIIYARENYCNSGHGFSKVSFFPTPAPQMNAANIIANIARGARFINYTAHGSPTSWLDPAFSITNIEKLGNKGKYPFVIGNCCLTNKFEVDTCFGEAWLRARDAGAIGYVGGSNSTFWDEDLWWGIGLHAIVMPNDEGMPPDKDQTGPGALDSLFEGNNVPNAGVMLAGNLAVESSTSARKQYYWEIYHLMGDPALKTRRPR
ncbi:MAG: hypothetical protein A2W80_08375 [Candidatus Riflebacteria bacterium GWC2_50_8]|nr:MAG: hypothetical protein A2W80_08375 [Candidatus Riflebacteria bacterium GWC2_50_8]